MNSRKKGTEGEDLAATYLEHNGYRILERNYRYDRGEIDLIALEGGELVFVEVKARYTAEFGSPEESVTSSKEEQMKKVAEGYLLQHQMEDQACRFDVVAITFADRRPQIRLFRNAFV